jgi:mutator protein MutT
VKPGAPARRIRVVAAIIERDGRVLVCRRRDRPGKPGLWEFPGGKIEPGESEQGALVRELREELAVEAVTGELYQRLDHCYPELKVELTFLRVTIPALPEPKALAAAEVRWVAKQDLPRLPFLDADRPLVQRLSSEAGLRL